MTTYRRLMRRVLFFSILSLRAFADSGTEVHEAVDQLYSKLDAGDVDGFSAFVPADGFTEFNTEGGELKTLDMNYFRAAMTSGAKIDLRVSDLKTKTIGDTVVVTGYRMGSITLPNGQRIESDQCLTMLWAKDTNGWKLQHVHLSQRPAK